MTFTEIFGEIVSIMEKDSATCQDYGAGDFEKYKAKISDDMDRMRDYFDMGRKRVVNLPISAVS